MSEVRTIKYAREHYWMSKHTGAIYTMREARWLLVEFFDDTYENLCEHFILTDYEVEK